MYEVLEILSSIRGGAKDVIDVAFVQLWLQLIKLTELSTPGLASIIQIN